MTEQEFVSKFNINLNKQQTAAYKAVDGPVLLLAVPGSGKTTTLIARLGYMIYCKGIAPEHILTVTYTVAAAAEMKKRFGDRFGEDLAERIEFRTINGICAKIIQHTARLTGKKAFELESDEKKCSMIIRDAYRQFHDDEYPTDNDVKEIATAITYVKNMLLDEGGIEKYGQEMNIDAFSEMFHYYNKVLKESGRMDYDDQMKYAKGILSSIPDILAYYQEQYQYICVDEAQDTSKIQHLIINMLAKKYNNLFMVGDEDQSIYGFRAAYPEALLNFEKEHPGAKTMLMEENFRSTVSIVKAADGLIQRNKARHVKHMFTNNAAGDDIDVIKIRERSGQYEHLMGVVKDMSVQTAVLYRNNESALPLIDRFEKAGISYNMRNDEMGFFTNRVVVDVKNIMKFMYAPADAELFMSIYYKLNLRMKKQDAQRLCALAAKTGNNILDNIDRLDVGAYSEKRLQHIRSEFKKMLNDRPAAAIRCIINSLGYGDYLETNKINSDKIDIMLELAAGIGTVAEYLEHLESLNVIVQTHQNIKGCPLILSTIHSSKGLEYDRVFLLDVRDGMFPAEQPSGADARKKLKAMEEERRLFYVGVTRAKNNLSVFDFGSSCFIKELKPAVKADKPKKADTENKSLVYEETPYGSVKCAMPLVTAKYALKFKRGMEVKHYKDGTGFVIDVNIKMDYIEVSMYSGRKKDSRVKYRLSALAVKQSYLKVIR